LFAYIQCLHDRYPKLKIYISELILDSHEYIPVKVEVKQSHNRPDMTQRVPGGLGSQIS
jgi:hypothetical protein